jgi:ABC-type Fe3+ transport system substrate-binding protein
VLLHPHSADFANFVIDDFKDWYLAEFGTAVDVSQLTMSSGACYTQVKTWDGDPEADVMWGGGEYYFMSMTRKGLLEGHIVSQDAEIEDEAYGWPFKDVTGEGMWYAAALSTFGIMWNLDYLEAHGLTPPQTWEDLTKSEYNGHIVMCDPAKSGSTTATVIMVIQHFIEEAGWEHNATGWENAWKYFAKVAGNVGLFTESSHAVPQKVVTGEYGIGIAIDYYSWEQTRAGENIAMNNGGATTVSTDPAGVLKGAPHPTEAMRWMDYLTSQRGQTAVGHWRMPIREDSPPTAPVLSAWYNASQVPVIETYNRDVHNDMFSVTREMFSFWLVKNHESAKSSLSKIKECEGLGITDYEDYIKAVEHYEMIPEASDSLTKAIALDTEDEAAGWENWGASHFGAAETSARAAISLYNQKIEEEATRTRNTTYSAVGVAVIAIIGVLYFILRRR